MPDSLENALRELEGAVDVALKDAKSVQSAIAKARKAAVAGELRSIDRSLSAALTAASDMQRSVQSAQTGWTFASERHFAEGGFQAELLEAASASGLQIFERDGRIYCYPMLITVNARDLAVMIDRKPERRVRPSALVRILADRQKQPQRFPVGQFLETLWSAYGLVAVGQDRSWKVDQSKRGPVVPLVDIYDALTLRPGASRDYPMPEFTRDIHLLDRQPDLATRDGWRFSLPAATATKGGRRLMVVDQEGRERIYVGISFFRE